SFGGSEIRGQKSEIRGRMQKQGAEPEQHHKKVKVISRARGGEQIPSGRLRENLIPEHGREFVGTSAQTDPMSASAEIHHGKGGASRLDVLRCERSDDRTGSAEEKG